MLYKKDCIHTDETRGRHCLQAKNYTKINLRRWGSLQCSLHKNPAPALAVRASLLCAPLTANPGEPLMSSALTCHSVTQYVCCVLRAVWYKETRIGRYCFVVGSSWWRQKEVVIRWFVWRSTNEPRCLHSVLLITSWINISLITFSNIICLLPFDYFYNVDVSYFFKFGYNNNNNGFV